ncbi:TPA: minor capsid protein [Listeria monocytogenes]|uniref:Minor capsid protein n=1 Tax=Listeria monocytogenes TaxID=1639 RepID=A0A5M0G901_LISMN|nr:putative minor capsid protein [Listeria monocytogenes]EAG6284031.1 minor capsid protein [Listeria monocytogenes CFSAN003810]MCY51010.1 minor capsid protein [Listeria monocytogenes serotype 4b]AKG89318.1 minor capsid protein [Listeria monocytogenes]AMD28265.1 minor capsid protein [Listeria monocytogenes]EAA0027335.1 minor capsid protein [Listeria monocytogenes]
MKVVKPPTNVPQLPLDWLIHNISYEAYKEENRHNEVVYEQGVEIEHVRVDFSKSNQIAGLSDSDRYDAVIFIDAVNSMNVPDDFISRSKIYFSGKAYKIVKVIPCFATSNSVHHWEIEVV